MKIKEYLKETGMMASTLAKRCGMKSDKLWRLQSGYSNFSLEDAYTIVVATDGKISFFDLLGKDKKETIERKVKHQTHRSKL